MLENNLIYVAHSAIQKGIRRGDLDLVKTSFDIMWGIKKERDWLKWRIPVIICEEAWYMAGEFAKLLGLKTDEPKEWKKFLYKLALVTKSKDAGPLLYLSQNTDYEFWEIKEARRWYSKLSDSLGPSVLVDEVSSKLLTNRYLSDYELSAFDIFRDRVKRGGMFNDRCFCIGALFLILNRGLREEEVREEIKNSVESYKNSGGCLPKKIDLLSDKYWYNMDMHTAIGKMVLGIYNKKYCESLSMSKTDLRFLWFFMESGYTPNKLMRYTDPKETPSILETCWWLQKMRKCMEFGGRSAIRNKLLWEETIKPKIIDLVKWSRSKAIGT